MCRLCCHLIPEATRLDPTCDPIVTCRRRQAGFGALNNYKFGARFVGRVANPTSLLHFTCAKAAKNPQRSIMGGDVPVTTAASRKLQLRANDVGTTKAHTPWGRLRVNWGCAAVRAR